MKVLQVRNVKKKNILDSDKKKKKCSSQTFNLPYSPANFTRNAAVAALSCRRAVWSNLVGLLSIQ